MTPKKDHPRKSKAPSSERDPWTPWGKWAKRRRERIERRKQARAERQYRRRLAIRQFRLFTTRSVVFVGLGVFACLIGFLVILLIGRPYPWQLYNDVTRTIDASRRLEENRERWQSLAVEHYTIDVEYIAPGVLCGPLTLEIEAGEVTTPPEERSGIWQPEAACNRLLEDFTVSGAFDRAENTLDDFSPGVDQLEIAFDDTFGHVILLEQGSYANEPPADCCWRIEWENLQPVNEQLESN